MTPEQWRALSPQQQAWHHQQWATFQAWQAQQAQPVPEPKVNVAGIVSLCTALLGLLGLVLTIAPIVIVLGPTALISGIIGEQMAIRGHASGRAMSAVGLVLGALMTLFVVVLIAT